MDNRYNHIWLVVGIPTPLKNIFLRPVGMMTFPTEWIVINSMVPVTTNPRVDSSHVSHDEIQT